MVRHFKLGFAACAALYAAAASAETLPVHGIYPAGNDAAASLGTIAIEPFGGSDGQQLGLAIADRLRGVTIDGASYFRIPPGFSRDAEAVLQGTASAEVSRRDSGTREEEVCVERDERRRCIRREKQEIPCWDHVVRLDATVRLVGADGSLLHAFDRDDRRTQRYCDGDGRPSTEGLVRQLAAAYADQLRADLAPEQRLDQVRVMETRRGLSDADGRAFRDAVRLTRNDHPGACSAWAALEERNPDHTSILFNLGLCAESRGELDEAHEYYLRALASAGDTSYPRQGAQRIERRRRAEAQLASRHGL